MKKKCIILLFIILIISLNISSCSCISEIYEKGRIKYYFDENKDNNFIPPDTSLKDFTENISEKLVLNKHSIGWLYVPDTGIDDIVLLAPEKPYDYYTYTNFDGENDMNGAYFTHYMLDFGNGTRNDMGKINTIFGHSFNEDPNSGLFSGLKNYRDKEFAENHPYFYFSTWQENMAFEVVAVFEAHIDLPYIDPTLNNWEYGEMLNNISQSSIYNYDVSELSVQDKVIMLSTCAMNVQGHTDLDPFKTDYRFVVMGKLVPPFEAIKEQAEFTVNPSPLPPDTFKLP